MPWFLNILYCLLLLAVSPVLLYRLVVQGKYRQGWTQKFMGRLPKRDSSRPCVWFHAVSVGEVLLLKPVIRRLCERNPDCEVILTVTTSTGHAVAKKDYPDHQVCYFPLDFSWAARNAIRRIRPSVIALVELELWPNFILAADAAQVPLVLINGRMSQHSHRGYRWVRLLMRTVLRRFTDIAAQSQTYATRLIDLGAPDDKVRVTGSVKFDGVESDRSQPRTQQLKHSFGLSDTEKVFIAGSTQAPEEEYAIDTWLTVRQHHSDVRLILVPRHQERFEEVARLVEKRGLPLIRRSLILESSPVSSGSAGREENSSPPVLLLDTLGELSACWGLADIAFVGGSLTNRGGQNMIEPAAYGAAVLFGPNTHNFRDVVDALLSHKAARVVHDRDELMHTVRYLLDHPDEAKRIGQTAQQFVLSQQGATEKTVEPILRMLEMAHAQGKVPREQVVLSLESVRK